ncbi:hypothetical protein VNI00_000461 [Paramarasmius palmivorus]|uniref:DUF6532 domain-containing protein n=1 Tax=Paramarasmius palmivorus TaxID=297713 RepID=A0AAW0E8D3_9AGAR
MSSRAAKAAATRAKNQERQREEEARLQAQVSQQKANGGRSSKRKAPQAWTDKSSRISKAAKTDPVSQSNVAPRQAQYREPAAETRYSDSESDDDKSDSNPDSEEEYTREVDDEACEESEDDLGYVSPQELQTTMAAEAPRFIRMHQRAGQLLDNQDQDSEDPEILPSSSQRRSISANSGSGHHSSSIIDPPVSDDNADNVFPASDVIDESPVQQSARSMPLRTNHNNSERTSSRLQTPLQPRTNTNNRSHRAVHVGSHPGRERRARSGPEQASVPSASSATTLQPAKPGALQKRFENEAPTVTRSMPDKVSRKPLQARKGTVNIQLEPIQWPPHASLVPHPQGGSSIKLLSQSPEIIKVVHVAIEAAKIKLILLNAFPTASESVKITRDSLMAAASSLDQEYPKQGYRDIKKRFKFPDIDFMDALGRVISNRFSSTRGTAKELGEALLVGYELTCDPEVAGARAQILLTEDNYVYPGTWEPSIRSRTQFREVDKLRPYSSAPVIACMRSLCRRFQVQRSHEFFSSTIEDLQDELEITPGLVALASTIMFALIREWRTGERVREDFEGNKFSRCYEGHILWLRKSREANSFNYHRMMHKLHDTVFANTSDELEMVHSLPLDLINQDGFYAD